MTDEVDMAMQFAAERKELIAQTIRLKSLIYDLVPLVVTTEGLIDQLVTRQSEEASISIKHLTQFLSDAKISLLLNMIAPVVGNKALSAKDIDSQGSFHDHGNIMDTYRIECREANKLTNKEWKELALKDGMPSAREMRDSYRYYILEQIAKTTKKMELSN